MQKQSRGYRQERLVALLPAVELFDFYNQLLAACDLELKNLYTPLQTHLDPPSPPPPKCKRKRLKANYPRFDLRTCLYQVCGVDLTAVDGIDVLVAQDILAEIDLDMNKQPTVKHIASWLRLCPNNDVSGGKVLSRTTRKTKSRTNTAFRMAAQSAGRSNSPTGDFYRP